jgi:hypothetical protein
MADSTAKLPRAPAGAKTAGRALWRAVLTSYELEEHELALLRQVCRVADVCDDLQMLVDAEGPIVAGRAHPALVELRQQRIVLARLIVAIRVPLGDEEQGRTQYRGPRGVYGIRGAV